MPDSLRPHGRQPTRLLCPWDFPGKDTGVGCHFLLQGIFPTQGLNLGLPHCKQILYWVSYKESPLMQSSSSMQMHGSAGDRFTQPWINAGMDHCPTLGVCHGSGVVVGCGIHIPSISLIPSQHLPGGARSHHLSEFLQSFWFCPLLMWVSLGLETHKPLGNVHDNPRPHMQSVWQGCTEPNRSLEVDQLSQISQLSLANSPFKMGALSSRDSLKQETVSTGIDSTCI